MQSDHAIEGCPTPRHVGAFCHWGGCCQHLNSLLHSNCPLKLAWRFAGLSQPAWKTEHYGLVYRCYTISSPISHTLLK